ncbi:MAG: SGNH/GDSL hydrolase family protein [Planctomycetota bacterium]
MHPIRLLAPLIRIITAAAFLPAAAADGGPPVIERLDPALAGRDAAGDRLWCDARRLAVEGRGWDDTEQFFDRLPGRAKAAVPDAVWTLARHSAGMIVRFATDADSVAARWTLSSADLAMPHMPATGVSGLDLYVRDGRSWRWIGAGRPSGRSSETVLAKGIPAADGGQPRDYLLHLPLYNGVESLEIGVPPGATMSSAAASAPAPLRPIVFYGTSITQGGCASRPGMAYPAILRRRLDRPVINLGFSGNGKLDAAVGDLLAALDAAAFVLDCLPNMTAELVTERTEPFVRALRAARPDSPIVVVDNVAYPAGAILPASRELVRRKNDALRAAFERLTADGVTGLHHVNGALLLGTDGDATVDGTHPTDLGFLRIADALEPLLRRLTERPAADGE